MKRKLSTQINALTKLNISDKKRLKKFLHIGQERVVAHWLKIPLKNKSLLLQQLTNLEKNYLGGIKAYHKTTTHLLSQLQKRSTTHLKAKEVRPVSYVDLQNNTSLSYQHYEQVGYAHSNELTFVLVAGGLGERLGYKQAKTLMHFSLLYGISYLQHYIEQIKCFTASKRKEQASKPINLIIMTSPATHQAISDFLGANHYFGLHEEEIVLLKQNTVPSVKNVKGDFAIESQDQQCALTLKPHGHGEIHWLMYQNDITTKLMQQGKKYLFFIQDTNAQVTNIVLSALGCFIDKTLSFAYIGVTRSKNEKTGLLVQVKNKIVNLEYNLIEYLFKQKNFPHTEDNFLGNTNLLLANLSTYHKVIKKTKGLVPKFINPKYADKEKKYFIKPARLESMMQDYAYLLPKSAKMEVLRYKSNFAFSPAKNNLTDALLLLQKESSPQGIFSAEWDFYHSHFTLLYKIGVLKKTIALKSIINKQPYAITKGKGKGKGKGKNNNQLVFLCPRVVLSPKLISNPNQKNLLGRQLKNIELQAETTLLLDYGDDNLVVDNLTLTKGSALVIRLEANCHLTIQNESITNGGFALTRNKNKQLKNIEDINTRGYAFINQGALTVHLKKPGYYQLKKGKISAVKQ